MSNGSSLEETRKRVQAFREGKLGVAPGIPTAPTTLTAPKFLTSDEARQYVADIPDDWMLKVYPTKEGEPPVYSFITPDQTEVKPDELKTLVSTGEWLTPQQAEAIEAEREETLEAFKTVFPGLDIRELLASMTVYEGEPFESYERAANAREDFLTTLREAGRTPQTELLLKAVFDATPEQIDIIFGARESVLTTLPKLDWLDKVSEISKNPIQLVPFVASGVEIYSLGKLLMTAKALEDGKEVSKEDLLLLKEYVDRSLRDTDWGYKVMDVVTQIIPFAGEFITTGGIFAVGKTATIKASVLALKKIEKN